MKIKTSELAGPALDRTVAVCEGAVYHGPAWTKYATDWSQGGPIIEREGIEVTRCNDLYFPQGNEKGEHWEQYWKAVIDLNEGDVMVQTNYGPTPLIAAMRCFVASCLGDEVEVPEELT